MTEKFDDAKWHYDGDFPADLPVEAGYTHIGMFIVWAITADVAAGEEGVVDLVDLQHFVRDRSLPPGRLFEREYDGKFLDDDLNDEGKAFAKAYYKNAKGYFEDYEETLGRRLPSLYHIQDSWETFDKLRPTLDQRFREWKSGSLKLKR